MCLTAPARVIRTEGDDAVIDLSGRTRRASLLLEPDISPGDWVLVGAGRVVRRLTSHEARELSELVRTLPSPIAPHVPPRGAST